MAKKGRRKGIDRTQTGLAVTSASDIAARDAMMRERGQIATSSDVEDHEAASDAAGSDVEEHAAAAADMDPDAARDAAKAARDLAEAQKDERERIAALTVEKEAPLSVSALIETANPNDMQASAARPVRAKDLDLSALDIDEDAAKPGLEDNDETRRDMARLEEVRRERERARQRREYEQKKKDELRRAAEERAAALEAKAKKGGGPKRKGKKGGKR